ncbi:heptaprenyl diphosphate synthase component 1 [Paenibacillus sp. LHD-117]|uniref:heptaprenyl diphosphate synthase component 1 n=1 Tax=Paenibacillus sp. LHD-117 TaxID=3071412 RepID=UPI0027E01B0E|nr:heptaprenyl diphosphate synthase component 1 [Paenibacillus sp. LHD-117]MDQ6418237.1 heptaprenyl diphosphate synthase component 1 [Paenibacillus sp. LHD-117]
MAKYRMTEIASNYANYDMIQAHTELPPPAEPRLRLLYAVLNEQGPLSEHSELYTAVVSLVQLGMDTHDLIDTDTRRRSEKEMRSRQLKVLAGDYFSARFYQMLAGAGQIEMISKLSDAVCEVNRMKVNLYSRMRGMKMTADDYFGYAAQLKSELFGHFAGMLEGTLSRLWPELLGGITRCEVAIEEMERCNDASRFERSWAYWHLLQVGTEDERRRLTDGQPESAFIQSLVHKYEITKQLAARLKQSMNALKTAVGKLESDKLASELTAITNQLTNNKGGFMPALNEMR